MKQTIKHFMLAAFLMSNLTAATLVLSSSEAKAQAPKKFNYQGIARDAKGNPMANQKLSLKLSVLPTQDATAAEYEETQLVTTNEFGLYTLQIGNGNILTGDMKTVKWETGNKYIHVAIDPTGGSNYADAGITQLLSVPYALYADMSGSSKESAPSTRATNNYIEKTSGAGVANSTSLLYDNGTSIGLGTTTPTARFQISQNAASVQEHLRMQNLSTTGAGRFTLYNDGASSYSTFTKYGTAYAGNYGGSSLYPNANLLAFGNNGVAAGDGLGRFLITNGGSIGMSLFKSGVTKLKFHADFASENVGIGGNSAPIARIHANNTDGAVMDLRLTNNTTGHLVGDGLEIRNVGTLANINNKENDALTFGTNGAERMRITNDGILLAGSSAALGNTWYRANFYQPNAGQGSSIFLQSIDAGNTALDGGQISLSSGINPSINIFNRETGGIELGSNTNNPSVKILDGGNVGIGITTPLTKLDVQGAKPFTTAGGFVYDGVMRAIDQNVGSSLKVGIYSAASGASNSNYGVWSEAVGTGTSSDFALFGRVSATPAPTGNNYGILAYDPINASNTYAAWFVGKTKFGTTSVQGSVMTSDAAGVASWSAPVAFKATSQVGGSLAISSGINPVIYAIENYDLSFSYNPSTGEFVAPVDGVYHFDYVTEINGNGGATSGYLSTGLLKDGSSLEGTWHETSVNQLGSYKTISGSADVQLLAGDIITVYFGNATNAAQSVTSDEFYNTFSGHIVR